MKENNADYNNKLTYLENMSEHDLKTKGKDICKTIIMDQKMIEDIYVTKRKNFEEINKKMLEEMGKNENSKIAEKLSFQTLDSYFELIRQESRREYNRRLLKKILG